MISLEDLKNVKSFAELGQLYKKSFIDYNEKAIEVSERIINSQKAIYETSLENISKVNSEIFKKFNDYLNTIKK